MHSFLIVPPSEELVKEKTQGRLIEFSILKIADVRELSKITTLKLTEKSTILIRNFDKASEEAQNAFLKALEEPQENLNFILTANNLENVLPTIQSRCAIEIRNSKSEVSSDKKHEIEKFLNAEIGEKLRIISGITKREEAKEFVNNLIIVGHELMVSGSNLNLQNMLEKAVETLKNLEANGNVGLQLTNLVVNS